MNNRFVFVLFLFSAVLSSAAHAHKIGMSAGFYELKSEELEAHISVSQAELLRAFPKLDRDWDGVLSNSEVRSSTSGFARSWARGLRLFSDGSECKTVFVSARKMDADGVLIDLRFECPLAKETYEIRASFVNRMFEGHRHLLRANLLGGLVNETLQASNARVLLSVDGHPVREGQGKRFLGLLSFGLEHILTGYDHLLFLLGIILVCRGFKSLLLLVTAFTVGHSLTLSISVLGLWSPSADWVEILIAASIIYLGVENFITRAPKHRWYLTLLFGLVHGFGFASMLAARGLESGQVLADLFAFNLGVEVGQLFCLLLVVPVLKVLRARWWFDSWGFMGLNALLTAAGVYWFLERLWRLWS